MRLCCGGGVTFLFFEYICTLMCVHVLACGLAMQNIRMKNYLDYIPYLVHVFLLVSCNRISQ